MFSHDFRTPLASILSSVGLIRNYEDRLTPERKRIHFDKIQGSVKQLLQMLDDMLTIAQMDGNYVNYNPQAVDLSAFVKNIVDEFAYIYIDSHNVTFKGDVGHDLVVDPKLYRQIVSNLISNAIKYSPSGSEVMVTLTKTSDEIMLEVQDEGIGIPEAELARLFEPFQRANNVQDIQGTGLGLTIVKQAVSLHHGNMIVESVENQGSIFRVSIPAQSNS
jgi:signal transduction histidine kinase